jgi:hypothetical protein
MRGLRLLVACLAMTIAMPAGIAQVWKPKAKPHKKEAAKSAPTSKTRPKHAVKKAAVKKKKVTAKKKKKRRHDDDDDFTITEEDFPKDD